MITASLRLVARSLLRGQGTIAAGGCCTSSCSSRRVPRDGRACAVVEAFQVEDSTEQCPDEWKIGHNNGSTAFSNIPVCPLAAEWMSEAVVFIQDGGEDDEYADSKYPKDECLSIPREVTTAEE